VASVRDPLPSEVPVEEEITHGSIEDILTAAALAESMKQEIFTVAEDNFDNHQDDIDSESEDVDVTTVPEDSYVQVAFAINSAPADHPQEMCEIGPRQALPDFPTKAENVVEQENSAAEPPPLSMTVTYDALEIRSHSKLDDDQDGNESLISFSEADDTIEIHDKTNVAQKSFEQTKQTEAGEEPVGHETPSDKNITPNDTVGINEMGDFVTPEINFFEDTIMENKGVPQTANERLSLDNTAIFSFPANQTLVTSPPKRQITALNEPNNNVFPFPPKFSNSFLVRQQETQNCSSTTKCNSTRHSPQTSHTSPIKRSPSQYQTSRLHYSTPTNPR